MNLESIRNLLLSRGQELFQEPYQLRHFTNNPKADALLNDLEHYPHAFVLACVMDRQMKAERAWLIPYLFSQKIGDFEFEHLRSLSLPEIRDLMIKPVPLHRYPERMSDNFYEAVRLIADRYSGDASNIWRGKPSSAEVVYRFLQFRGVGPKIATMATNILARELKVPLSDYYSVDISADVHVRRVFVRLGLVPWTSITANVLSGKSAPDQLIQNLDDQDLALELLKIYDNNPAFKLAFNQEIANTLDEEWKAINAPRAQQSVTLDRLTPAVDGTPTLGVFRDEPELRGAKELLGIDGVKHVIFGHTHTEIDGDEQAKVKNYFNTGSWVGSIDLSKRENRKRLSRLSGADLKDDSLFDLRFRTAMIEVDNFGTRVELQRLDI